MRKTSERIGRKMGGFFLLFGLAVAARAAKPEIGIQVALEPGIDSTQERVDLLFDRLAEQDIRVARISVDGSYSLRSDGTWDFSLYDRAFRAAQQRGIKLVALLRPQVCNPDHSSVPHTEELLEAADEQVERMALHFKDQPALDTYIIVGEHYLIPRFTPLAMKSFRLWLQKKYGTIEALNKTWLYDAMMPQRRGYASFDEIEEDGRWLDPPLYWPFPRIDWFTFSRDYMTWYLRRVADKVRKIDPKHPLHIYAVGLSRCPVFLDPPQWPAIADSGGASAHPASNFNLFKRDEWAMAMSYTIDVTRGVMEPKPAWISETQAGNNIHSGGAYCPTPEDLAQTVWTYFGGGAERILFWELQARQVAYERGEWGLLDFQLRPTDRLNMLGALSRTIKTHAALFRDARPAVPPITIILSQDAMTLDSYHSRLSGPGKDPWAHVRSVVGFYAAFHDLGITPQVKFINRFDWEAPTTEPQLVILPNLTAITAEQAQRIEAFTKRGNTTLITGFTGFYDPYGMLWPMKRFPLQGLLGANFREIRVMERERDRRVELQEPPLSLPTFQWLTDIANGSARPIGRQGDRITAVQNKAGTGEAIWIPSTIGWAAQLGDRKPLARYLESVATPFLRGVPFAFNGLHKDCTMRVMRSGGALIMIVTNGSLDPKRCRLKLPQGLTPKVIWGTPTSLSMEKAEINLGPRETLVAVWGKADAAP